MTRLRSFPPRALASAAFATFACAVSFAQTPAAPALPASSVPHVPAHAQARVATVQVRHTPERADWTYAPGEPVRF